MAGSQVKAVTVRLSLKSDGFRRVPGRVAQAGAASVFFSRLTLCHPLSSSIVSHPFRS